jgi:hypothetical protein
MARSSLGFKPLRECNWTVKRRAGETPAFPPIKPVSRRIRQGAPDFSVADRTQEWVAGDAVLIAPVSKQIPCKQGILQGNSQFQGCGDNVGAENRCAAATF